MPELPQLPQRKNGKLGFISKSKKIDTIIDFFLNYALNSQASLMKVIMRFSCLEKFF